MSGNGHIEIHIRDDVSIFLTGVIVMYFNLNWQLGDFIFTSSVGEQC